MHALFGAPRALSVSSPAIPVVQGQPALVPLKLEGTEGLNSLFHYTLVLQTPDALHFNAGTAGNFDLQSWVGLELTCRIELEGQGSFVPGRAGAGRANQGAGVREISGLITSARFVAEDGRHAVYEITIRPWLYLATLTSDCKVFQDLTPVEVIERVLADYAFASDMRLIETYPVRDYTVQYNETDWEFVSRLMQEWGINYHFEHSGGVHRLIWSDHNGAFQVTQPEMDKGASAYHQIPFYPLGHKIDREYIHGFSISNQITSGAFATREYDYTRPRASLAASAAMPRETGHADHEIFLWHGDKAGTGSANYSQPHSGADKAANQTEEQGRMLARLRMQTLRQSGLRGQGVGHVRGIVPGCTFTLTGHPRELANCEYIVLDTRLVLENVGEDTQRWGALSDAQRHTGQWRVEVAFEVQPTSEAVRPASTQPKPTPGGPETALVVGPGADTAESNIYTDHLGRIKVEFPWDRYGVRNQNSSCWVRVSSTWAGNQLGAMHLPRIGEEVMVDFLGGDPDLPIAKGRVYNAINMPPWSLPGQQALSGFRSRELVPAGGNSAAGRSNHLILDDTDQKIQAQLKSDHQHSQISLGHITRIEDNAGRKDHRGEGLELRTDGHGVLRAQDGLFITTDARPKALAHAKDMGETTARLAQGQDQHLSLGELAQQHAAQTPADQSAVANALQAQNDAIKGSAKASPAEGRFAELQEPHLLISSPAGIQSTTPGTTHHHSAKHHAISSGAHTSISSAKSFLVSAKEAVRLFAYKSGIKLVSAAADIEVRALEKSIHILSRVSITETADAITFTAKEEVCINGGGSFSVFNAGGITHGTLGVWDVNATTKSMDGAKSLPVSVPAFPIVQSESAHHVQFKALEEGTGRVLAGNPYMMEFADGSRLYGKTDALGMTQLVPSAQAQKVTLQWLAAREVPAADASKSNAGEEC